MQRVSAFLPSWEKRSSATSALSVNSNTGAAGDNNRASSGGGFFGWPARSSSRNSTASNGALASGASITQHRPGKLSIASVSNGGSRIQRETFWPSTLDTECDKAARILKSFCSDGYLAPLSDEQPISPTEEPQTPAKVMQKIPRRVIQNAAGIAVFTCMRSGLWMTGSGGSGVLIARKSDGTWSPPSGIMLHTPTLSFVIGVDIYDCILVVSDLAALEALTRPRVTLGEDVGLASGQNVTLDSSQTDFHWKDPGNTVLTYLKARGQHQKVNLTGCILTERSNENERFYGSEVSQMEILGGAVREVEETKPLYEVIKMAEGRSDYDTAIISRIAAAPAPGDAMIESPQLRSASSALSFGIPQVDDPDPFGILALEMAGMEIKEAGGNKARPTSNITSALTSPTGSTFPRESMVRSHRESTMSSHTVKSRMSDAATQTVVDRSTPATTPSSGQSDEGRLNEVSGHLHVGSERKNSAVSVDYTTIDTTPIKHLSGPPSIRSRSSYETERTRLEPIQSQDDREPVSPIDDDDSLNGSDGFGDVDDDDFSDMSDDEEPVVFEVAEVQPARTQAVASRMVHAKGNMVNIPKRLPPPLPVRNPGRRSRMVKKDDEQVAGLKSPMQTEFAQGQNMEEAAGTEEMKMKEAKTEESEKEEPSAIEEATGSEAKTRTPSPTRSLPAVHVEEGTARNEHKGESVETDRESFETADDRTPARRGSDASSEHKSPTVHVRKDSIGDEASSVATSRASTDTTGSFGGKKHPSSIFTGPIPGGESANGSSVTTPTSDRPFSTQAEASPEQTPKKTANASKVNKVSDIAKRFEAATAGDQTSA